jgi:poly-beta-1,6-N-acetyl-D-glucosamine synthase
MQEASYVIVTPARNEAAYIGRAIEAVVSQVVRPMQWIIVDDGSSDETAAIGEMASTRYPWIRVVKRPDRGRRAVGSGSVEAFSCGLRAIDADQWDFICNLDADMVVGPRYYETMLKKFRDDPRLGIAVGSIYETHNTERVRLRCQPEMVAGGAKCWRRSCFKAIGGIVEHSAWDGIDCYKAMMCGWRTRTLTDSALNIDHLRPLCTSYTNVLQGWLQRGRGMWFFGADPLWLCASSIFHAKSRPLGLAGGALLCGFAGACVKREPQLDDAELRRFVSRWQRAKLKTMLFSLLSRPSI